MGAHLQSIEIPTTLALAIMATLGYVFGTLCQRRKTFSAVLLRHKDDLSRAQAAVSELVQAICVLRNSAAEHHCRLKKFQNRVAKLGARQEDADWFELCREVDGVLDPTLQLANEIASAQQRIRYQSDYLMNFSETPTEPPVSSP